MCGFVKRKFQYIHVCTPSKTNHFVRFKTNNNNYVTTILEKMSLLVYDRERRNSGLNKVKIVFNKLHKSCLPTNSLHVCYFKHILSIQEWISRLHCAGPGYTPVKGSCYLRRTTNMAAVFLCLLLSLTATLAVRRQANLEGKRSPLKWNIKACINF